MHFRRLLMSTSLIFLPPISISPEVGSKNLNSNLIIVDFLKNNMVMLLFSIVSNRCVAVCYPLPDPPTMAIFFPGGTKNERSFRMGLPF